MNNVNQDFLLKIPRHEINNYLVRNIEAAVARGLKIKIKHLLGKK